MANTEWYCVKEGCGKVLGTVLGGELTVAEDVTDVSTRGPNLLIICPKCGTKKVWYTSDQLTRAITQLIDSMATEQARQVVKKLGKLTSHLTIEDE